MHFNRGEDGDRTRQTVGLRLRIRTHPPRRQQPLNRRTYGRIGAGAWNYAAPRYSVAPRSATPTTRGVTIGGAFFRRSRSTSATSKPAPLMPARVSRLQVQPCPIRRLKPLSLSCQRASLGSSDRTCSRKSNRPLGLRTRRISASARAWSGTVQSRNHVVEGGVLEWKRLGRCAHDPRAEV